MQLLNIKIYDSVFAHAESRASRAADVWRVFLSFVDSEMWILVLACTLPLPAGYFMPVFVCGELLEAQFQIQVQSSESDCSFSKVKAEVMGRVIALLVHHLGFSPPGAAVGRLLGEGLAHLSSTGLISGQQWASVNPGGYALIGRTIWSERPCCWHCS